MEFDREGIEAGAPGRTVCPGTTLRSALRSRQLFPSKLTQRDGVGRGIGIPIPPTFRPSHARGYTSSRSVQLSKRGEKHGSKRAGFGVRLLDPSDAYESMLKRHVLAPSCTHSTERSTVDRVADQDAAGPRSARGEGANGGARLRLSPRATC